MSSPMHVRRLAEDERGAALVEFTLVLPVLLLLFVLVVEIGHVLREHQMVTQGVRDATRYLGRVPDPTDATVQATARALANRSSLARTDVEVVVNVGADASGGNLRSVARPVTVTATVTVDVPVVGPVLRIVGGNAADSLTFTIVDQTRHYGG